MRMFASSAAATLGSGPLFGLKREKPDLKVVIVERDLCGAGASGRNGGVATNWWAKFLSVRKLCGHEEALRICSAAESAIDEIGEFCAQNNIDAQYRKDGLDLVGPAPKSRLGSWDILTESLDEYGVNPFSALGPGEAQARTGSPRNIAGIFDPNAATVQPAMLARGLRRHALELGVEIYEKVADERLERSKIPVVHTEKGQVKAQKVVVAMNAWGAIFPSCAATSRWSPATWWPPPRHPNGLKQIGFTGGECMTDSRVGADYYRNTTEGRVVFGKPLGKFGFGGRVDDIYECPTPAAAGVTPSVPRDLPQPVGRADRQHLDRPDRPRHESAADLRPPGGTRKHHLCHRLLR